MAKRPARCYRRTHRPNTRQSKVRPRKSYVKGAPKPLITDFEIGKKKADYNKMVLLISKKQLQITDSALEAARVASVQKMEKNIGKGSTFFIKVRVYPHHILRENTLATGAGADRFQQGMRKSFGKPIGTAAQIDEGQPIMEIRVKEKDVPIAKTALKQANYKLPTSTRIIVKDI